MANILIKNSTIVPMLEDEDNGQELYFKGDIYIEDNLIKYVGPNFQDKLKIEKVIDGTNLIALPGLINTHSHVAMTLLRSYADDLPLMEWLQNKIWPIEAKMKREDIYWGSLLGIAEMLLSGTTTFADMYDHMFGVAKAVEDSGIRASLCRGLIGINPNGEFALQESEALIAEWHNKARGRITTMVGPHAPYTCPPVYLEKVTALAEKYKVGIHIHVAETLQEITDITKEYGKRPVEHLLECGIFKHKTLAAHCVHLEPNEIEILKKYGVSVAHNPQSNMKLASGIAPVPALLKAGVNVALGTDGASSNNNLDMFEEMRTASLLHKVNTMNATTLPAYEVLKMATKNGAKALGMEDKVGILKEKMLADIILLDMEKPHFYPKNNLIANIVYSAQSADVNTVIIDGEIVVDEGKLMKIDLSELLKTVESKAKKLIQ